MLPPFVFSSSVQHDVIGAKWLRAVSAFVSVSLWVRFVSVLAYLSIHALHPEGNGPVIRTACFPLFPSVPRKIILRQRLITYRRMVNVYFCLTSTVSTANGLPSASGGGGGYRGGYGGGRGRAGT
ncbi:unnamed protein product, partial [Pylaiella littoralis]